MKRIIKFLKECPSFYVYSVGVAVSIYYKERFFLGICITSFLYELIAYGKDKINKEYTDWLEDRADHWYQKYKEEKYGKKEESKTEKIVICKN